MSNLRSFLFAALALALSVMPAASSAAPARPAAGSGDETSARQEQQYGALERGWRTGYSDGYQTGWRDSVERRASDYRGKEEYRRADRAYIAAYGALDDYRDGYRQGFESGYGDGFSRRGFNSELPSGGVTRRGAGDQDNDDAVAARPPEETRRENDSGDDTDARGVDTGVRSTGATAARPIPSDTIMRVELLNRLSTDVSQRGDRFEARVVEPREYEGAVVSGRVAGVQRAGKVSGRSQLQLDFEQIRLTDGDWTDFRAQLIEVVNTHGDDDVGEIDPEGGVRGKSSTKDDAVKVGASAGVGAILGAITGGGKGAAIGAIIGGAAGTGGVMTQRGKEIRFERGQQLRIRTSGEARTQ